MKELHQAIDNALEHVEDKDLSQIVIILGSPLDPTILTLGLDDAELESYLNGCILSYKLSNEEVSH